ncbi:family 16 glycosylhydrolase [Algibacter sp. 2305UL17-15]|uniref:family 16 glycosylhydrolase n=1 Tax=Algibacter sp. 2305UL17-15 TaxID=3231268 RepID=UPI00345B4AF7
MKSLKKISILVLLLLASSLYAQNTPYFLTDEDPKPLEGKWVLVKKMSDEFEGKKINTKKWQISGQGWIGRAPGLFLAHNVTVADGYLQITTTQLPKPIVKQGKTFTHGGGYAGSRKGMTYGYYECRMKANKTFMSSTFWLINDREDLNGCDNRTTELDIQECVGEITGENPELQKFDHSMNFNTHSRNIPKDCDILKGTVGGKAEIGAKVYDGYHVYGVWWKSKDEVLFFLDGKFQTKITPAADFNIPMYLRMVVETYNWNPVPADGGMTGSSKDRTTYYDWVRSWKLKD